MMTATRALQQLEDGNRRFVDGKPTHLDVSQREAMVDGQEPFAVVLGCADSRVPVELVFDQGLGDLFVIRVAGNVVTPSVLGSIEYAVVNLEVPLVMVLGHSGCGAVQATVQRVEQPAAQLSPNLASIVDRIAPSVQALVGARAENDDESDLVHRCMRENVRASMAQLSAEFDLLEHRLRDGSLMIVGAEYNLETGIVDVFEQRERDEGSRRGG